MDDRPLLRDVALQQMKPVPAVSKQAGSLSSDGSTDQGKEQPFVP